MKCLCLIYFYPFGKFFRYYTRKIYSDLVVLPVCFIKLPDSFLCKIYLKVELKFCFEYTTKSVEEHLIEHNQEKFENCFSMRDRPWDVFHAIDCENVDLAKRFEQLIK